MAFVAGSERVVMRALRPPARSAGACPLGHDRAMDSWRGFGHAGGVSPGFRRAGFSCLLDVGLRTVSPARSREHAVAGAAIAERLPGFLGAGAGRLFWRQASGQLNPSPRQGNNPYAEPRQLRIRAPCCSPTRRSAPPMWSPRGKPLPAHNAASNAYAGNSVSESPTALATQTWVPSEAMASAKLN